MLMQLVHTSKSDLMGENNGSVFARPVAQARESKYKDKVVRLKAVFLDILGLYWSGIESKH